ncbi:MAG: hypothetical protein ACYCQI_06055 [Gammaproteobacteria bacterium]
MAQSKKKAHGGLQPRSQFLKHVLRNILFGWFFIIFALYIGMWGYHYYEHMSWVDAFENAAMILSGMGPATNIVTTAGKLFAGAYALFSGLAFIVILGVIFSPVIRRFFHKLHLEDYK